MQIGYIGLGAMGSALAGRLIPPTSSSSGTSTLSR